MAKIRNEIYDETGLIRVEYIEVEDPIQDDQTVQEENSK